MAGLGAHGEAPVAPYELRVDGDALIASAHFPIAGLVFERRIALRDSAVVIRETLTNIAATDRAIGWTAARDAGAAISRAGIDAIPRVRHAIESIRVDVRRG